MVLIVLVLWYLSGVVGSIVAAYIDWREGVDVKISDIVAYALMALFGPFMILLVVLIAFSISWNTVLIKGKGK
jgi:hypothetical protein